MDHLSESVLSTSSTTKAENFVGWGTRREISDLGDEPVTLTDLSGAHTKLGELSATSICGNDITSSCLYVAALCALQAGVYAPIALLMVTVVLYFFRKV